MGQKKDEGKVFDMLNFKGIFFENEHQKYTCPITGAHFEPRDLCRRLNLVIQERDKTEIKQQQNHETLKASITD